MGKRYWLVLPLLLAVTLGITLWHWKQTPAQPRLEHANLADGSPLTLVSPGTPAHAQVLVAIPAGQSLSDSQLLALSQDGQARILQFFLVADGNCEAQQQRLQAALTALGKPADLVAGIDEGASLAWRWLASQGNDQARALSVNFDLATRPCPSPLPGSAAHGHWLAAWNDNPSDASARFARQQVNAETIISDYATPLSGVLDEQLRRLLQGDSSGMPVIEVPANGSNETLILFYSGDGGWRDLDRDVAAEMAKRGYPVLGIDALRYFWQHKSPQQGAADLSRLMQSYREKWGIRRFVLAGFSFGADVLPALYNRLPEADQQQVTSIILLALARSGSFEIEVQGWLGKTGTEAATGPELRKLPAAKVLCIYGQEEQAESGCTLPEIPGEILRLPGGHHYDGDYPRLAERLLQGIAQRNGDSH